MEKGRIIKALSGFFYVQWNDSIVTCKGRGTLKKTGVIPVAGDWVLFSLVDESIDEGMIEEILPRQNEMLRPPLSNLDQLLAVFAVKDPIPNLVLLDRILLRAEMQYFSSGICFNKTDLLVEEKILQLLEGYQQIGYPVFFVSAKTGEGIEGLRAFLRGKTTALAGASGVGKSTVINALYPDFQLKTGELSRKIQRGKHTTRYTELLPAEENTWIADTPGFSTLKASDLEAEEVRFYFRDFLPFQEDCRFQSCLHLKEPGCRVKKALKEGHIMQHRYENYEKIIDEIQTNRRY